jgi:hypothetical protein
MNWILANKEWVFSGVGVAVIGSLIALFFRRPSGNLAAISADRSGSVVGSPVASGSNISQTVNIVSAPATAPPSTVYSGTPTPDEIAAHLKSLPVFQRNAVKDSYIGLKICWPVELKNLHEISDVVRKAYKTDHTHTLVTESRGQEIEANINISRFPRLKISHRGTPMRLSGEISGVGATGFTYWLKDVEIEFDEVRQDL